MNKKKNGCHTMVLSICDLKGQGVGKCEYYMRVYYMRVKYGPVCFWYDYKSHECNSLDARVNEKEQWRDIIKHNCTPGGTNDA